MRTSVEINQVPPAMPSNCDRLATQPDPRPGNRTCADDDSAPATATTRREASRRVAPVAGGLRGGELGSIARDTIRRTITDRDPMADFRKPASAALGRHAAARIDEAAHRNDNPFLAIDPHQRACSDKAIDHVAKVSRVWKRLACLRLNLSSSALEPTASLWRPGRRSVAIQRRSPGMEAKWQPLATLLSPPARNQPAEAMYTARGVDLAAVPSFSARPPAAGSSRRFWRWPRRSRLAGSGVPAGASLQPADPNSRRLLAKLRAPHRLSNLHEPKRRRGREATDRAPARITAAPWPASPQPARAEPSPPQLAEVRTAVRSTPGVVRRQAGDNATPGTLAETDEPGRYRTAEDRGARS